MATVPRHWHVWMQRAGSPIQTMLAVKLTRAGIARERARKSRRVVRRWWHSREAARKAMLAAGLPADCVARVRECEAGDACPEKHHVLAN